MEIEIFGTGCPKCKRLGRNTQEALDELEQANVNIVLVDDPVEIARRGVLSTPALAIDGEVKVRGRVPSTQEIIELLD